jgi:hypothetical protein
MLFFKDRHEVTLCRRDAARRNRLMRKTEPKPLGSAIQHAGGVACLEGVAFSCNS